MLYTDFRAANYSIRGLRALHGYSRPTIRMYLWEFDPDYMSDYERRHGPNRITNRDHAGNRARRRSR